MRRPRAPRSLLIELRQREDVQCGERIRVLERQVAWLASRCDALRVFEVKGHELSDGLAERAVAEEQQYRRLHGIDV